MQELFTRVMHQNSEHGRWELVLGRPDPSLRGFVHGYQGYDESGAPAPVVRQEVPSVRVPLIVNFGARWKITDSLAGMPDVRDSFVAGLHERSSFVTAEGAARCIQVDFTPVGAHLFFGVPMHELSNRVVDVEDVLGRDRNLIARLEAASTWEARFALLDSVIATHLSNARRPAPEILWAWRALEHTNGAVRVSTLAEKLGRSRRHLLAGFREQIGLGPKTAGRIIRFNGAVGLIERRVRMPFAELAQKCGYFDQAHLMRDFREFTGTTPREFASRVIPGGGVLGKA
ncbi:AraC family transcriptional regulator [soil metagenome]